MANGKLLAEVLAIKGIATETQTIVKQLNELVVKHEQVLYGDSKNPTGEAGLLMQVKGLGSRVDYMQKFAMLIWTAIFAAIQFVIALIRKI